MKSGISIKEEIGDGLSRVWQLEQVTAHRCTQYQDVLIARTTHGVTLFCDGERQSSQLTQLFYHEALLVPALLLAAEVSRILIIGSSEGVLSKIASAAGAHRVDHVDIDAECVRLCAKHLPYGYTRRELMNAEQGVGVITVIYRDGWDFLVSAIEKKQQYDIVALDLPDERLNSDDQHNRLYSQKFLGKCRSILRPGGVVVSQAGCPTLWRNNTLCASIARFTASFSHVTYHASDEHEWAFLSGGHNYLPELAITKMFRALPNLSYAPKTLDFPALVRAATPPYSLRDKLNINGLTHTSWRE